MNEPILLVLAAILLLVVGFALGRRSSAPHTDPHEVDAAADPPVEAQAIVERMGEGVLVLDENLRPSFTNISARLLLGINDAPSMERLPSQEVLAVAERAMGSGGYAREILNLWYPAAITLKVTASPFGNGLLILLQDVTQEQLAQQIRKEFVSHASHELKSPVAGIQTLSEAVMQALEDDPEAAARFAQRLTTEASRLGRLIADLLDLSRLEDMGTLPDETNDLRTVIEREIDEARSIADAKSMVLESDLERVSVRGDGQQLGLMVGNLLQNAVRYTPEQGTVTITLQLVDGAAVVQVNDTGIGIPREAQSRIFERFYRVDKARSRARGGTGLGLAIVKHVAEIHGGDVNVESELGTGSTFTVRIPAIGVPEPSSRTTI